MIRLPIVAVETLRVASEPQFVLPCINPVLAQTSCLGQYISLKKLSGESQAS